MEHLNRNESKPGRFYAWFALKPTSPRMIKAMLGILAATVVLSYALAF